MGSDWVFVTDKKTHTARPAPTVTQTHTLTDTQSQVHRYRPRQTYTQIHTQKKTQKIIKDIYGGPLKGDRTGF